MEPHQFFNFHHWWGKIIGLFLGYIMSGPVGALFGLLVGNLFDRALGDFFARPHWLYHAEKRKAAQAIFFKATFIVMGHIAKVDGHVSKQEIKMATTLMDEMRLNQSQKKLAKQYFNDGKSKHFDIWRVLSILKDTIGNNTALLKLFVDIQYRAAQVDGLSTRKITVLNHIIKFLGFVPLQEQYRFYEDFTRRSANQHQSPPHSHPHSTLDHAFAILGVTKNTSQKDLKYAYRRLISKNHPDKLIAQGLPEAMVKIAKEKTQQIIKAYDEICEAKGW